MADPSQTPAATYQDAVLEVEALAHDAVEKAVEYAIEMGLSMPPGNLGDRSRWTVWTSPQPTIPFPTKTAT